MYLLLVIVIGLHQVYATLKMKEDRWPLRGIALRAIEFFGRVFFLPFVVIYFVQSISYKGLIVALTLLFTVIFLVVIGGQELVGLRQAFVRGVDNLIDKVNHPDTTENELSPLELVVLNYVLYKKFSTSKMFVANEIMLRGQVTSIRKASIQIRNLAQANNLVSGMSDGGPSVVDQYLTRMTSPATIEREVSFQRVTDVSAIQMNKVELSGNYSGNVGQGENSDSITECYHSHGSDDGGITL